MADCIDVLNSIGMSCAKTEQVGGVKKKVWIGQKSQLASYTKDADGYVDTLVMDVDNSSDAYKLVTVMSKKNVHSGTVEGVVGTNVNLFNHSALIKVFTESPAENEALSALAKADELFVLMETEYGKIQIFGLDRGLEMSALAGSTGVELQDDTGFLLTLSGEQTNLPDFFLAGGSLATSIAYLDNISKAVA
jgi:hypothetical protein